MNNTFTPGEWIKTESQDTNMCPVPFFEIYSKETSFWIAQVRHDKKYGEADAYLITASKDMHAALTELIEIRQQRMISGDTRELMEKEAEAYNKAYVAIEKAVPTVTYEIPAYPSDY